MGLYNTCRDAKMRAVMSPKSPLFLSGWPESFERDGEDATRLYHIKTWRHCLSIRSHTNIACLEIPNMSVFTEANRKAFE
jgi:hypothetical protein